MTAVQDKTSTGTYQSSNKIQDKVNLDHENDTDDLNEAQLVSEFPVPPPYYKLDLTLTPPPIPYDKLIRSTKKSYVDKLKTLKQQEEEERRRCGEDFHSAGTGGDIRNSDGVDMISSSDVRKEEEEEEEEDFDVDMEGPFVTVFGQESYVEDPTLLPIQDDCSDPKEVQNRVTNLNQDILQDFVTLVGDLVNNPEAHQKCRDKLLRNIESILKECNKFREHQSREILIETLEQQLNDRLAAINTLNEYIQDADEQLKRLKEIEEEDSFQLKIS